MKNLIADNAGNFQTALDTLTADTTSLQQNISDAAKYLNTFKGAVGKTTDQIIEVLRPFLGNEATEAMKTASKTEMIDPHVAAFKNLLAIAKANEIKKISNIEDNYDDIFGKNLSVNDDWVKTLKTTNPELYRLSQSNDKGDQQKVKNWVTEAWRQLKNEGKISDGILSSNGSSMLTSASNVTPINDGSVQLAKSDPKDFALFAKTGGPFDTLFNGIFAKINEISKVLPKSLEYIMPLSKVSSNFSNSKDTTNNGTIKIDTVKIELNGKLELSNSNGQNIDLINEIKNNPILLRSLTQLISESINKNINGGKSTYTGGTPTPRFNNMGF